MPGMDDGYFTRWSGFLMLIFEVFALLSAVVWGFAGGYASDSGRIYISVTRNEVLSEVRGICSAPEFLKERERTGHQFCKELYDDHPWLSHQLIGRAIVSQSKTTLRVRFAKIHHSHSIYLVYYGYIDQHFDTSPV
ncbi:hypothetical protein F5X98DRAFT_381350 [Xylaria grammica]|nr:hypothetical protein F5X98DRAFT_381350 [Xylaria grammica]